jgi:hypothetical protein
MSVQEEIFEDANETTETAQNQQVIPQRVNL